MNSVIKKGQVQKALNEASHNARYGSPSVRAGRFDDDDAALKEATARHLLRILQESGFYRRETRGFHETWHNPAMKKSVVVPTTGISQRNANALLLQAGLSKAF
jgi:predicted RNA binding protein YcfA (HicA-like mRNA interferase family)